MERIIKYTVYYIPKGLGYIDVFTDQRTEPIPFADLSDAEVAATIATLQGDECYYRLQDGAIISDTNV